MQELLFIPDENSFSVEGLAARFCQVLSCFNDSILYSTKVNDIHTPDYVVYPPYILSIYDAPIVQKLNPHEPRYSENFTSRFGLLCHDFLDHALCGQSFDPISDASVNVSFPQFSEFNNYNSLLAAAQMDFGDNFSDFMTWLIKMCRKNSIELHILEQFSTENEPELQQYCFDIRKTLLDDFRDIFQRSGKSKYDLKNELFDRFNSEFQTNPLLKKQISIVIRRFLTWLTKRGCIKAFQLDCFTTVLQNALNGNEEESIGLYHTLLRNRIIVEEYFEDKQHDLDFYTHGIENNDHIKNLYGNITEQEFFLKRVMALTLSAQVMNHQVFEETLLGYVIDRNPDLYVASTQYLDHHRSINLVF